jgi:hypothetical protein
MPDTRWHTISMDFIVELPESDGHNVVMVVVDSLTKRAHFLPHFLPVNQPWQQHSHGVVGRLQSDNLTMLSRKPTRPNHEKYHISVDRAQLLMISRCYRATQVAGGNCRSLHCSATTRLNKYILSENPLTIATAYSNRRQIRWYHCSSLLYCLLRTFYLSTYLLVKCYIYQLLEYNQ